VKKPQWWSSRKKYFHHNEVFREIIFYVVTFLITLYFSTSLSSEKKPALRDFILGGFVTLFNYLWTKINQIKKNINDRFYVIERLLSKDYKKYDSGLIAKFIRLTKDAQEIYSLDRSTPDIWYLNDNWMAFLCFEELLIRKKNIQGYRLFIWEEKCYGMPRYQQFLLLNVCAGINTYIVPLEILSKNMDNFKSSLDEDNKRFFDKFDGGLDQWSKEISENPDGIEFLLTVSEKRDLDGDVKSQNAQNSIICEQAMSDNEKKVYKLFFDWIKIKFKKDNEELALLNVIDLNANFTDDWSKYINERVKKLNNLDQ
jgi:hypothetical protein